MLRAALRRRAPLRAPRVPSVAGWHSLLMAGSRRCQGVIASPFAGCPGSRQPILRPLICDHRWTYTLRAPSDVLVRGFATTSRRKKQRDEGQQQRRQRRRPVERGSTTTSGWFSYLRGAGLGSNAARAVEQRFEQHSVPFPCLAAMNYRVLRNTYGVRQSDARAIAN